MNIASERSRGRRTVSESETTAKPHRKLRSISESYQESPVQEKGAFSSLQNADESDNDSELAADEPILDSCWSWFVCFGAWVINVLVVGVHHIFGIFFVELLKEFPDVSSADVCKFCLWKV